MPEKLLDLVPFLLTVEGGKHRVNTARIIEALIIAVIGGAFAGYIALAKMEVRFEGLQQALGEVKQDVRDLRGVVYVPRR